MCHNYFLQTTGFVKFEALQKISKNILKHFGRTKCFRSTVRKTDPNYVHIYHSMQTLLGKIFVLKL